MSGIWILGTGNHDLTNSVQLCESEFDYLIVPFIFDILREFLKALLYSDKLLQKKLWQLCNVIAWKWQWIHFICFRKIVMTLCILNIFFTIKNMTKTSWAIKFLLEFLFLCSVKDDIYVNWWWQWKHKERSTFWAVTRLSALSADKDWHCPDWQVEILAVWVTRFLCEVNLVFLTLQ